MKLLTLGYLISTFLLTAACRKETLDPEQNIPANTQARMNLENQIRLDLQSMTSGLKQVTGIVEITKIGFERFGEGKQLSGANKFDAIENYEFPIGNLSFQQEGVAGTFEYQMNGNLMLQQSLVGKYEVAVIYQGSLKRNSLSDQPVIASSNLLFKVSSSEEDIDFQLFNDGGSYKEVAGGTFSLDLEQFSGLVDHIAGSSDDPFRIAGTLALKNNGYRVEGIGENVRVGNSQVDFAFHEFEFRVPFKDSEQGAYYSIAGNLGTRGVALGLMEFRKSLTEKEPKVSYEFY